MNKYRVVNKYRVDYITLSGGKPDTQSSRPELTGKDYLLVQTMPVKGDVQAFTGATWAEAFRRADVVL